MAEHSKKLRRPPKRHRKHAQKPKRTSTEVAAAVAKKKEKRLSTASAVSAASSIMTAGNCTDADKLYAWLGRKTGVTYESHTSSQAQLKREKQERYEQKGELIRQVEQLRASDDQDERARIGDDLVERIARLVDGAVASSAREAARTLSVLDGVKAFRRDRHQYKRMLQRNLELESRMNYMEQGLRAGGGDDDSDLAGRGRAGSDRPGSVDRQLMHVNLKSLRRVSEAEDGYLAVYSQGYEEGYKGGMEDGTAKADREMERRERVARILGPKDRGTQTDRPRPRPPTAPPASRPSRESHVSSPSDRMSDPELEVRPLSLRSSTGRDPATGASGTDDINDGMSDLGHGALLTPIGPPPAMDVDVRSSRRRRGEPQEFPEPPSPQDTVPSPPWDDSDEGDRDALHSSTTITNGHPTAYGAQGYSNSNSNNEEDGEGEGGSCDPSIDVVTAGAVGAGCVGKFWECDTVVVVVGLEVYRGIACGHFGLEVARSGCR
ncbi:hypothetical protein GMORB2_5365 [Geosmithia morbida]|uniref:Uncharacterized protein n=1 Tax=Geosmithia morbida TaxID=1094350 RepID=A0A9P5D7N9_9HYPO|nr:uncharacterized protein GMORB2_5365 [Geosmithia morbida]KAF4124699.1 hypothetical protein GMORB2_5365 [Geosmithia morbida]